MFIGSSKQDDFSICSDSDWAGDQHDHQSISGYVYNMAGAVISWGPKKPSTALSSTEGEYMALMHVAKESIWIQGFLTNIGFPPDSTKILGDNQGALALAVNPTYHACMKHIRVHHSLGNVWT